MYIEWVGNVRNYTPHPVTIIHGDGTTTTYPSEGIARVTCNSKVVGTLNGVPLTQPSYGKIEGLPDPEPGVFLIVSRMIQMAAQHEAAKDPAKFRGDLLVPGGQVRDEEGRVIGCTSFDW